MCKDTIFKYKYQTIQLELLYIIISETIDDLIAKKRNEIKEREESTCVDKNESAANKVCDLYRQINVLEICRNKIKNYISIVQNMEEDWFY